MKRYMTFAVALVVLCLAMGGVWAEEPRDIVAGAIAGGEAGRAGEWIVYDWKNAGTWSYRQPDGTVIRCPLTIEDIYIDSEPSMHLGDGRLVYPIRNLEGYGHAWIGARPVSAPWDRVQVALVSCCVYHQAGTAASIVDPYWLTMANGTVIAQGTGAAAADSPLREWTVGSSIEVNLVPNHAGGGLEDLAAGRELPLSGAVGFRRIAPESIGTAR